MIRLLFLLALMLPAVAHARWTQATTSHFIVYSSGSPGQARAMAALLEDYDKLLRMLTQTREEPSPNKLEVYLVANISSLRRVRPLGNNVAGFYSATPGGIAAFSTRENGMEADDVLLHEYAHHFMNQYFPFAYPLWYVEGFAEYAMTAKFTDKVIEVGRLNPNRAYWLVNGAWMPARDLLADEPQLNGAVAQMMFYPQCWLAVHYIFTTGKSAQLGAYLDARSHGTPGDVAFRTAFSVDFDGFDRELRAYRTRGQIAFRRYARSSDAAPVPVTVATLPASADDLLLYRAALRLGVPREQRSELLTSVRQIGARFPSDPFATRVRAQAEILLGDRANGIALIEPLIAASPNDTELLYLRGVAAMKGEGSERFKEARRWFTRAFRTDPNHYPTLFRYAEAFARGEGRIDVNTLNALINARELAPQVGEIGLATASALMANGRFAEARGILQMLAADRHDHNVAQAAATLLARADAREPAETAFSEPGTADEDGD